MFPARENILSFDNGNVKTNAQQKKKIILGINRNDLKAIHYLDEQFRSPIEDELYQKNRDNIHLIAIDHLSPEDGVPYDLYLKAVTDNQYEVFSGSDFGDKLMRKEHFTETSKIVVDEEQPDSSPIYHPELNEVIEKSKDDRIWDELAEICFGCGICTYVCPICYCYETEDVIKIDGLNIKEPSKCSGCRERRWDSCMLPDFAAISSGNFRPALRNRIYNWYHHKFVRTPAEHGFVGCVDCKRCIAYCPAQINFEETLNYLIKKYT